MSGFESQRAAIEAHFTTEWASRTPISYEEVPYTPIAETAYVAIWINAGSAIQVSFPAGYRYTGIVQVDINCPLNVGTKVISEHADVVSPIFMGQQVSSGSQTISFRSLSVFKTSVGDWKRWSMTFEMWRDVC